jgi:hypothetical protein
VVGEYREDDHDQYNRYMLEGKIVYTIIVKLVQSARGEKLIHTTTSISFSGIVLAQNSKDIDAL